MAKHVDLSDEHPSSRADASVLKESTGLHFEVSIGPVKGKGGATIDAHPTSPSSIGLATLLLAAAGSVPALLLVLAGGMLGAQTTQLAVGAAGLFLAVFATGTALTVRGQSHMRGFLDLANPPSTNGNHSPGPAPRTRAGRKQPSGQV